MKSLEVASPDLKSLDTERELKSHRQGEREPWTGRKGAIDRWKASPSYVKREPQTCGKGAPLDTLKGSPRHVERGLKDRWKGSPWLLASSLG